METITVEPYCGRCGTSLVPLEVPHLSASCSDCGKSKYFVRPGDRGKGIQIEAGESFTIPSGWITLSLDPAAGRGRLMRGGVPFLFQQLFLSSLPKKVADFIESAHKQRDANEVELARSDKLAGIDLKTQQGGEAAFKRLREEPNSTEWYLYVKDMATANALDAIDEKDAEKAAYSGLQMGLFHGLSLVAQPHIEETVWLGYKANLAIHEAATAAEHVPGEAEALAELDPLFRRLGEATLQTWIEANVPVGPRIAVQAIPEPLILARAKWHLMNFKREREDATRQPGEIRARSELRIKWLTLIGALLGSSLLGGLLTKFADGL